MERARLFRALPELAAGEALFLPADPPRRGRVAFWTPGGGPPDLGVEPEWHTLVRPAGEPGNAEPAPAVRAGAVSVTVADAVPLLTRCRALGAGGRASAGMAFWGAAATLGLSLLARGRSRSERSPAGFDVWRVGPLDGADEDRLGALAAAMPPEARAVPVSGGSPLALPSAEATLRAFLDAVADALTRTPAARHVAGGSPFAAAASVRKACPAPERRTPAGEVAKGAGAAAVEDEEADGAARAREAALRVSLRLEVVAGGLSGESPSGQESVHTGGLGEAEAQGRVEDDEGPGAGSFRAVVQLHSLADPSVLTDAADLWAGTAEAPELFGARARADTRLALRRAARVWPPLAGLSGPTAPTGLDLCDDDARDLLGRTAERLAAAGVAVHWPGDLVRRLTATGVLEPSGDRARSTTSSAASFLTSDGLLDFRWRVALGGEELTADEVDRLVRAHRPVVRLRGQWVLVDGELVRRLRTAARAGGPSLTPIEALGAALTGHVEVDGERVPVAAGALLEELRARIADPEARAAREPHRPPKALAATLRGYQLRGLNWLHRMTSLGLGACLADDMGLGKTVTLIALHLRRQERKATAGPTLVVCPASLLGNWEREIRRFAPTVPVRRFHGPGRELVGLDDDAFVLTTYGTMRRDAELLAERPWSLLVADEAQHVKNPHAHTARALRRIPSRGRVALTGTPVENNLSELWALLDWTTPGLLGTLGSFRDRYARAVEGDHDAQAAAQLASLVGPFLLRRRKSDPGIAPELPPKTETDQPVSLTREQVALYGSLVRELMAEIEGADGMARRGLVMKLLTGLKQVCNHPAQYLKEPDGAKLPGRSGKLALLDELLDTVLAEDGSVLVFTQYVAMARLIERHLAQRGVPSLLLHGGTPVRRREQMVDAFQSGGTKVFLLSLKAAGTGLNLTRAGHVVHYDRWWNPAVEDQATDRAYRIGQTQPVQVHKLVAEGTVEERVAGLLRQKRALADAVLGSGEAAFSELSDGELAELVALRGRRA
ncbi:DEAD/DEAH box helicase [Streptomyces sp. NBC_00669]|nr:DEAD/DEAH box helicase [Streptomyces sp. NBC_00669]